MTIVLKGPCLGSQEKRLLGRFGGGQEIQLLRASRLPLGVLLVVPSERNQKLSFEDQSLPDYR